MVTLDNRYCQERSCFKDEKVIKVFNGWQINKWWLSYINKRIL